MELSQQEMAIVQKYRAEKAQRDKAREFYLECLETTARYRKWLNENEAGSTYTTFCDDFEYAGEDRQYMFKVVEHMFWRLGEFLKD